MKASSFRRFCIESWYSYKDEVEAWEKRQVRGKEEEYFKKYKWFLKAKYKQERS